jgi:translation initiation factor IF-3
LDLVEISPNADPPVCKIMDYKKFVYEQKKRDKILKAKSTQVIVKEIVLDLKQMMIMNLREKMLKNS